MSFVMKASDAAALADENRFAPVQSTLTGIAISIRQAACKGDRGIGYWVPEVQAQRVCEYLKDQGYGVEMLDLSQDNLRRLFQIKW